MNILQILIYSEGHIVGIHNVEDTPKNYEVAKDYMYFMKESINLEYFRKKYNIKSKNSLAIRDSIMAQFEGEEININTFDFDLDSKY